MDALSLEVLSGLLAVWLFAVGLAVGSFLNVVIARLPENLSVVRPRSRCPKCGHQLTWYENIPVFSWIALRGRCRSCKTPISPRYLFVELLTGLLYLACLRRFDWSYELVPAIVLVSLLIPLTFIDLEHWILPFEITRPGIALGILLSIPAGTDRLLGSAIGAAVGFGLFWALEFVGEKVFKKEALGAGDKWLLALLGAFLGWQVLLGIILLSSLQGAVVGIILLKVRGRAGPAPQIPAAHAAESDTSVPGGMKTGSSNPNDDDDDWQPEPNNIPFGPWLSLAGLELLLLAPWLERVLPSSLGWVVTGRMDLG